MAYLSYGQKLPSRESTSRFMVIGNDYSLCNINHVSVSYKLIRNWLSEGEESLKKNVERFLKIDGEELTFLCDVLLAEKEKGKWEQPFDSEIAYWRKQQEKSKKT